MTPLDVVAATSRDINTIGAQFYFGPPTLARGKELGLDGFRFYMLGRGGALGNAPAVVVQSAFGYFHKNVVDKIWNSASERLDPVEAARAYMECCAEHGRKTLDEVDGLESFCDAAQTVLDAADTVGLTLFAAVNAQETPADLPARAMHQMTKLREHRGSCHLVALVANAVPSEIAHAHRRPDDTGAFGWEPSPEVSDADRTRIAAADVMTDELTALAYEALTAEQAEAFVAGTRTIAGACGL